MNNKRKSLYYFHLLYTTMKSFIRRIQKLKNNNKWKEWKKSPAKSWQNSQ